MSATEILQTLTNVQFTIFLTNAGKFANNDSNTS